VEKKSSWIMEDLEMEFSEENEWVALESLR
jgi:hypothetical protein